ncbi:MULTISPECIES: DUF1266 domain-containing protein [Pseudomonas]|uniref:DUF1266 domain-containing protein n=1 Tax=Pseudomonas donghuensis TaxID=1163398 RepID=A0AAP0SH12_9PSED|nr:MULTISPECIES: DUF1266 domain-containing protein [Pseudomonas]MDF9894829.1 hypothetical protein [Pseudomonas vranovensis]KDN97946.1 DUF1266 domain-containing protein [Pseudomonas donghuensis]MCP6692990.1 DUF1266 domain-containing protein [Pseudomonas donghuensis]MCP6699430.1 DUF1266 domain-containing protein [Pseudomonas donghuensis]QHF29824.1 hypothetical protein PspR32_19270 [Pseudomonas sp. R32]
MEEIEQHWLYALSAPMVALNGASYTAATYFETDVEDEADLKKWWGISNRQELLKILTMADTGHAQQVKDAYWQAARCLPSEWQQVLELLSPRQRIQYQFALRTLADCGQGGVRAWDIGRMSYLLRAGLRKGYVSLDESLWLHGRLALRARHYYNDWDRYLAGYLFGRALWNCSSSSDEELAQNLERQGSEHWNRCIMMNLSQNALDFFANIPWDLPLNLPECPDTLPKDCWS